MGAHSCPDAVKVEPLDDYVLRVTFADGKIFTRNLSDHLTRGVFRRLRDKEFYKKAHAKSGAIVWDENLDMAPEAIYFDGIEVL